MLAKSAMTAEQIKLADSLALWIGQTRGRRGGVLEHQIIAATKYGALPHGCVVRHVNGDKSDNRPSNLLLGSRLDNARDHKSATLEMMQWRERAMRAEHGLREVRQLLAVTA